MNTILQVRWHKEGEEDYDDEDIIGDLLLSDFFSFQSRINVIELTLVRLLQLHGYG
ncbi:MAG: hypothetical protein ACI8RD_011773 [Bacillariaceae sp.]|jgi:hypothetical protein